jgi:hypothetical protein
MVGISDVANNFDNLGELFGLTQAAIGDVVVDVARSYTPSSAADLSDHPVEDGFDISNARVIRPHSLIMECILTDPDFSGGNIATAALTGSLGNLTTSWRDKRDMLNEMFESSDLITVSTPEKTYDNMAIVSITPDRRAATGNAYFFTIELREVKIVKSDIYGFSPDDLPVDASDAQAVAAEQVKPASVAKGKASPSAATAEETSVLSAITGFGG